MAPKLLELIALDEQAFQQRFGASPLARTKRRGLLRNVAIALGNWGDRATIPALVRALHDVEPLIRGHAAWALGRISGQRVQDSLRDALEREEDGWVREEIWLGLASGSPA